MRAEPARPAAAASSTPAEARPFRLQIVAPPALKTVLESNLDIVRWSKRGELTPGQIDQLFDAAPEQARELAATEGYFNARVTAERVPGPRSPGDAALPTLQLTVVPGEPVRISMVEVAIVGPVQQDAGGARRIERARKAFGLRTGEVFRQEAWDGAKTRAVSSLARNRYAAARVTDSRAEVDPAANTAALRVVIDSGPSIRMGPVQITGLQRYPRTLVENLNPIPRGSVYDEAELLKYQRRLLLSGRFASAIVTANPDPAQPADTPVRVTVVEAQARRVELGVGYSTDRGARAQAGYTDRNVFDRAWLFTANLAIDRLEREGLASLQFPRHPDGWHYGLEARIHGEDIQGQTVHYWSATAAHAFLIEEYESALGLQYLSEHSELVDGTRDDRQALFLNQRWLWNGLDDPINPRKGYTFQVQAGGAAEPLLSSRSFGRLHLRANYLQPLGGKLTLGLRAEAGAVIANSRSDIPSPYVFRTGGDTSIRGYAFQSLGVEEGGAIVGGRYLLVGSAELTRWISREWGVGVFLDGGNAWDDVRAFKAVFGYGAGARWRGPLGNLSLDLAYGEARNEFRVHFNAGIVFR